MALRNQSVAKAPVTTILGDGEVPTYDRELTADEEVLVALGYKPEFKREFSLWTTFCVSFAVLGLLPSFASTLYYVGLLSGKSSVKRKCHNGREADWRVILGHGLCGYSWNGLGMVDCHGLYTVCGYEHGRAVFFHANQRRALLRFSGFGSTRLGTLGSL